MRGGLHRYNVGMKKVLWLAIPLLILGAYLAVGQLSATRSNLVKTPVKQEPQTVREASITIRPETILQGDPGLIVIEGAISTVKSLKFDGKEVQIFEYNGPPSPSYGGASKPTALVGIDLRGRVSLYKIIVTFEDGKKIEKSIKVGARTIVKAPLGIPEKLGGNTPASEQELLNTLAQEGAIINAVKSGPEKLWSGQFRYPLNGEIIITDVYGYSRLTGASTIAHKGTDFRAATGTPVYAMNSGKVAYTDYLRNYGNTIIIDHGLGLLTIYMHLSEVGVKKGDMLDKGQFIAKSGESGYVLGPHLHLTVRINGISIDPMKFMALVGSK